MRTRTRTPSRSSGRHREHRGRRTIGEPLFAIPRDPVGIATVATLVIALVLGGSYQRPIGTMAIELVAVVAIAATLTRPRAALPAWIAAGLALIVLAIETVPLPYPMWAALPGHDLAAGARAVVGLPQAPLPLSLDPYATVGVLLALLPGLAMFAGGLLVERGTARLLAGIVVLAGLASAALGAMQLGGGPDYYPFSDTHFGYAVGLFANRNHEADFLLIAILMVATLSRVGGRGLLTGGGIAVLLAVGVATAGSRTGLLLLVPVLLVASSLALMRDRGGLLVTLLVAAAAFAALAALSAFNPVMGRVLARYQTAGEDLRFEFWRNTWFAIRQYWPTGSGLGTFVPVYQTVEPLDTMPGAIVNHAHDDYLELVLELGAGGIALVVGYLVTLCWGAWRGVRRSGVWPAAGALAIAVLLAHSIVDYPLRTPALMAVFGLLNALVFRRDAPRATRRDAEPR